MAFIASSLPFFIAVSQYEDSEEARYAKKQSQNTLRTEEYRKGEYSRAGVCVFLPVPEDAPFFVKDYSEYIVLFIIEDDLKMFYYRGLKEWDNEKAI